MGSGKRAAHSAWSIFSLWRRATHLYWNATCAIGGQDYPREHSSTLHTTADPWIYTWVPACNYPAPKTASRSYPDACINQRLRNSMEAACKHFRPCFQARIGAPGMQKRAYEVFWIIAVIGALYVFSLSQTMFCPRATRKFRLAEVIMLLTSDVTLII